MAFQSATVTLASAATGTCTFSTPAGNYRKAYGLTITDGGGPVALVFAADSSSSGTTTVTVNLTAAVTGTVNVMMWDTP